MQKNSLTMNKAIRNHWMDALIGGLLKNPTRYLSEFRRKLGMINCALLGRLELLGIEPGTLRLPILRTQSLGNWWAPPTRLHKENYLVNMSDQHS